MKTVPILLTALLLAAAAFPAGELSGRRAPGFSLPDRNLVQHDLADYRGRLVVLEFMRTDCPACVSFTGVIKKVKARFGEKVAVLSVVNPPDNQTTVVRFINALKMTTPVLFDCGQVAGSYFKASPQRPTIHLPHVFLIDANGFIVQDYAHGGATEAIFEGDALLPEIDRILAKSAGAQRK